MALRRQKDLVQRSLSQVSLPYRDPIFHVRALAPTLCPTIRASLAMEFMLGQRPEWVGRNPGCRVRVEYLATSQQALPQPSPVPWKGSAPQGESQQTGLSWSVLLHRRSGGGGDLGSLWRMVDVTAMSFGESEAEWSPCKSSLQPGAQPFVSLG